MKFIDYLLKLFGFKAKDAFIRIGRSVGVLGQAEWITEPQLNHHVHIVGASGFGKTVLISHILRECILQNRGVLFIDLKGDRETVEQLNGYVKQANREKDLKVFSLDQHEQSSSYNLLSNGTATQLRDRIMQSLVWSEEFYKNQAASFLLRLLSGLCWLRDNRELKLDLATVLKCAKSADAIEEFQKQIPVENARVSELIDEARLFLNVRDNFTSLQGLRTQLESIVYSDFHDRVTASENNLDLFNTVREAGIAFMYLDTRRFGETATAIGRFIIQDLKAVSARIDAEISKRDRRPFTVVIDEFADLAQEDFIGFLDRARSSKIGIVVAHQEISDLDRISPEFCGRLMGNTATLFAFLQKRPESAELISGIAGTKKVWKTTMQTSRFLFMEIDSGKGSRREVEEFNIHPNVIKSLKVGECVRIGRYPRANASKLKVLKLDY